MNDFSYKDYLYLISARKLLRPMGEWKYFAKVSHLYKKGDEENKEIDNHHFGETYGETEEIAQDKMHQLLIEWIDKKLSHPIT